MNTKPNKSNTSTLSICLLLLGLLAQNTTVQADFLNPNNPASVDQAETALPTPSEDSTQEKSKHFQRLISQAEQLRNQGKFFEAKILLTNALELAQILRNKAMIASALGALGNIYTAIGPPQQAYKLLSEAEALARELNEAELISAVLINLGNYHAFQNHPDLAYKTYLASIQQAGKIKNHRLTAKALANAANIAVKLDADEKAAILLNQAVQTVNVLPDSQAKNLLRINLAHTYLQLHKKNRQNHSYHLASYQLLSKALAAFTKADNLQGASYAWGLLGSLYENDKRYADALQSTRQALFKAQQINDKHLLYLWLWQKARLLTKTENIDGALESYRESINLLDSLRFQMLIAYQSPGSVFVDTIAPVYTQYIELLLKNIEQQKNAETTSKTLQRVRDTIEHLKAAEIRDYFGDECVDALQAKSKPLWKASTSAVIVYPILLTDRTHLLLDFPDGHMKLIHVPVSLAHLTKEIRAFRKRLEKRTTNEYRIPGKNLYSWLIEPLLTEIKSTAINTLVFVPDGPLLTIPLSALYNGSKHLIEQYAVAITPGVQLIDPRRLSINHIKPVLAGISQSVENRPALKYVKDELQYIQHLFGGDLLLDRNFKTLTLKASLADQSTNLLHISTHAFLSNNVHNSYLLTYDGHLSIDTLADYVGMFKFRKNPLELLILSACETAQGDDKAALGLSGIAVRAGARSAIGSLWKVNDAATSMLMKAFYQQFKEQKVSRAIALQKAKLVVMKDLRYKHPGYWSAFLLINNWL